MIKDSEIVTKKYLTDTLRSQKIEIIEELRAEIHESIESAMRNIKAHQRRGTDQYIGAWLETIRDENRAFRDGITMLIERTDNHEKRLEAASL